MGKVFIFNLFITNVLGEFSGGHTIGYLEFYYVGTLELIPAVMMIFMLYYFKKVVVEECQHLSFDLWDLGIWGGNSLGNFMTFPMVILLVPVYSFYMSSTNFSGLYQGVDSSLGIYGGLTMISYQWGWTLNLVVVAPTCFFISLFLVNNISTLFIGEDKVLICQNMFKQNYNGVGDYVYVPSNFYLGIKTFSLDVNHAVGSKELGVKMDSFPDSMLDGVLSVSLNKDSSVMVSCYEYCGLEHTNMYFYLGVKELLEMSMN